MKVLRINKYGTYLNYILKEIIKILSGGFNGRI